jgi:acetyl esterase/lipase
MPQTSRRPSRVALASAALLLCGLGAGCILLAGSQRIGSLLMPLWIRITHDVPYGPYPENVVDILEPRWGGARPRPAVLVFHGGGWLSGDRCETHYRICRRFVKMGFVVANAEYRLGSIPPALQDAAAALSWFRTQTQQYAIDPRRIVITGVSAGAQLALLAAFRSDVPPAAVINFYGPSDLNALLERSAIRQAIPGSDPEVTARQMSPLTYVRPGLPPVFSVHGTADELIPSAQTAALTRAIQASGGEASAFFVDGGGHGLSIPQEDAAFEAVAQFLRHRGIIQ